MNGLALPLQLQGDGGAVGRFLAQQNVPYPETLGTLLGFVLGFAVVYIVGKAVVSSLLNRVLDRRGAEEHAKKPLMKVATLVVAFVALGFGFGFAGLGNFLQSLATIGAAATLAIGFAMQDVIANFVAGIFIFTDKPFRINDWIEWDGNSGVVEDISFRVTRVRTFDNELLTVPNSQLTDGVIKNPVAKDKLRLQVPFGISYDDDIHQATDIILDEAEKHDGIMATPEPSVRLTELGDSAVVLKSRIWISDPSRADFVKTRGEYVTAVKQRFDDAGIEFPYPNRTLSGELSVGGVEQFAQSND
ncbi:MULTISPECIES: mechanosensitive ion channel family protein [Haloferax]|uniref:Small-conductance mechanosensitive channel n=1 Tax=Haloferax massiliensis TaxID=1476858 RepID=A0A0D6JRY9_9EURY|nr:MULTISPECIES: mechanosensitive ion channel family protein [Haloferax]MDS0240234.1 mechanosensitive ion channel family protein [Haloferax sp. S2CR25]MDS0443355.1 mechanosensitive ion channel family protein [Haloferax sp. S2CR25-2]CQR50350.1 Small-conductance mechanosensitive channel [Haloferax massiliensis]